MKHLVETAQQVVSTAVKLEIEPWRFEIEDDDMYVFVSGEAEGGRLAEQLFDNPEPSGGGFFGTLFYRGTFQNVVITIVGE